MLSSSARPKVRGQLMCQLSVEYRYIHAPDGAFQVHAIHVCVLRVNTRGPGSM